MKRIIIAILLIINQLAFSQDNFTQRVKTLMSAYKQADFQALATDFEGFAVSDKNWLTNYYAAYVNVRLASFSQGDKIDFYCEKAEKYLKIAENLNADMSEIYALYAFLYSEKVKVNPMFRGAKMGKTSREYAEKSIALNPENPRPYTIRAIGLYHTPKIFGGGKQKASPLLKTALEKFENFKLQTPNHPNWGKAMANYLKNELEKE